MSRVVACVCAIALYSCAPRPAPRALAAARARTTSVVLISLDAFRVDFLDRGLTPRLSAMARDGVRAQWMTPSYPTLTFPAHYTLVTGLHPDRHGIVHNTMRDAVLGSFSLSNRPAVENGAWWGGEPVWVAAERAGLRTAAHYWPGSEAAIQSVRPNRWLPYDGGVPAGARVDMVLGWLDESEATRPRFVTLYFEALDTAAHNHGPGSPELDRALAEVDASLGRLVDGLAARSRAGDVDLIVVSDHGMAPVPPANVVAIEDIVDSSDAVTVTTGQVLGFNPVPGREREAQARLVGKHEHYECWRKGELPERWKYGRHSRVPAIVCQMQEGWDAASRASLAQRPRGATRGSHGFDPALQSMRTIFIAHGPSFRRGLVLPAINAVDVYPLLMTLLGLEPRDHDGDVEALAKVLRPPAP